MKNALLYLVAMALCLRMVVGGSFRWSLRRVHAGFAILIIYAVLSVIVVGVILRDDGYNLLLASLQVKANLIDYFLFFAIFYYGVQTQREAHTVLRVLLVLVVVSSILTVGNASGWFQIGVVEIGKDGRVQGVLGEQNQYAAFLVTMLPLLAAAAVNTRALPSRAFWMGGIGISLFALLMTVSRGGFLALAVATIVTCVVFRRALPVGRLAMWFFAAVILAVIAAIASGEYGELLQQRVIGQTFVRTGDASSGRTEVWLLTIRTMMESPWTLVTGFGWFAYESMGFRYLTHNHYLHLWFNLGLAGVIGFVLIQTQLARVFIDAARASSGADRYNFIAGFAGLAGLSAAIFFVNLFTPWPYVWALFGVLARMSVLAMQQGPPQESSRVGMRAKSAPPRTFARPAHVQRSVGS